MGKSSQIWCRMSMNFCECVLLQVDISDTSGFKILGKIVKLYSYCVILIPFLKRVESPNWNKWQIYKVLEKVKKTHKSLF